MTLKESIGYNIKKYRKDQKLSQQELARLSGYARSTIRRWEKAQSSIGSMELYDIAITLNTPIEMFFKKPKEGVYNDK